MIKSFLLTLASVVLAFSLAQTDATTAEKPVTYTVQVVALSDGLAVEDLRDALASQGYPAYVIEAGNEDVPLYRLRVGAFASRDTAMVFAEALDRQLADYSPSVAVLDSVAPNTPRLQAALLARYPYVEGGITTIQIVPWGDDGQSRALRFQGAYNNQWYQAVYQILEPAHIAQPFPAWRAAYQGNGFFSRIYNLNLWPDTFAELSEADILKYQNTLLSQVASELAMDVQEIANTYVFYEEARGIPYVVLGEGRNLSSGETVFYPLLGYPEQSMPQAGPQIVWLDRGVEDGVPEGLGQPVFNLQIMPNVQVTEATLPEPATLQLDGNGWRALPDGGFISLTDGESRWKAALGYPLYAYGEFLITHYANEVLLYRVTRFTP